MFGMAPRVTPKTTDFRLTYDLTTCSDPLVRLGIHGLWRVLHYAGVEEYAHLYPKLVQSPNLSWTLTDTGIEINAKTPEDLAVILKSMIGDMPQGIVVPPGYPTHSDVGTEFYLTGATHTAITGFLFPNSKSGRTKSLGGFLKIKEGKVHPDDVGGLTVKKNAVSVMDLMCKLKGINPSNLIQKVSGALRANGKSPIEQKVTTHCSDPVLGKSVLFKSLADQMVGTLVQANKGDVTRPISTSGPFHPLCGRWENKSIRMPFTDAFAVYFSAFGYVYTECTDGFIGVGMDFPTFKEADKYHRIHIGDFQGKIKEGFLSRVNGASHIAAFVLLTHLECPTNRTYPIVSMNGKYQTAWDFHFKGGAGEGLYGKFQAALDAGMEYEDAQRTLLILRLLPLESYGDKSRSVYDQVYQNLSYGMDWHHNLSKVAFLKRKTRGEWHKGLFIDETKVLQALVTIMQNDNEKLILDAGQRLFLSAAREYDKQGYREGKYDRAREFMVKVNLARAIGKGSLLEALWRVQMFAKCPLSTDVMDAIHDMSDSNPRGLKNLLILGAYSYTPKTASNTNQAANGTNQTA